MVLIISRRDHKYAQQAEKGHDDGKALPQIVIPLYGKLRFHQIVSSQHPYAQPEHVIRPRGVLFQREVADSAQKNGDAHRDDAVRAFPRFHRLTISDKMIAQAENCYGRITDIREKQIEGIVAVRRKSRNEQKRQESGKNVVADEEHDADERHETDRSFHLLACQNEQTRGEQFEGVKQIAIQQFSCVGQKRFPIHAL